MAVVGVEAPAEAFLRQQPLVTLDLAVMPRRVRTRALMPGRMRQHGARDTRSLEVGPVIGHAARQ